MKRVLLTIVAFAMLIGVVVAELSVDPRDPTRAFFHTPDGKIWQRNSKIPLQYGLNPQGDLHADGVPSFSPNVVACSVSLDCDSDKDGRKGSRGGDKDSDKGSRSIGQVISTRALDAAWSFNRIDSYPGGMRNFILAEVHPSPIPGRSYEIAFSHFNTLAGNWATPRLVTYDVYNDILPLLLHDEYGNRFIVWGKTRGSCEVWAASSASNAVTFTDQVQLSRVESGAMSLVAIPFDFSWSVMLSTFSADRLTCGKALTAIDHSALTWCASLSARSHSCSGMKRFCSWRGRKRSRSISSAREKK